MFPSVCGATAQNYITAVSDAELEPPDVVEGNPSVKFREKSFFNCDTFTTLQDLKTI